MTREEARNILSDYDVNFEGHTAEEITKAFDVAFRALDQEPCEDAVSRKALIERISNANWIDNHNGTITCDKCHTWFNKDDRYNYMHHCPNCGAKMESEDKE